MERFPDISHWEPNVDFKILRDSGYYAISVKASEANSADPSFIRHFTEADKYGFIKGAYHYYRVTYDAVAQANIFYAIAKSTQFAPEVDVEGTNNVGLVTKPVFAERLRNHLLRVEHLFGRKPIIYTGFYVWKELVGDVTWANEYPLYMAKYSDYPPTVFPANWTKWLFWQYTDREPIGPYTLDCNKFNGTKAELYALANLNPPPSLEERMTKAEADIVLIKQKIGL
jgi:lysozyme